MSSAWHASRASTRDRRSPGRLALALLLALSGSVAAAPLPAPERDPEARLNEALEAARNPTQYMGAVAVCRQVLATPKLAVPVRQRAWEALIEVHARHGARQEAIDAAEALRLAYPDNGDIDRRAVFTQADQFSAWTAQTNPAPAIARLQAFAARRPKDLAGCAQAWLRIAKFDARANATEAAMQAARQALETDPTNTAIGVESLWLQQELAARLHQPEARLLALQQSLGQKYSDRIAGYDLIYRRELVAATLRELKRYSELRVFAADLERIDDAADRRQQWCFLVGECCREEGQLDAALAAYERVFTGHATVAGKWPEAQARIVDALAKLGRLPEALRAARVLWEAAVDAGTVDRATAQIAELLRQADGNAGRAEAWLAMQRFGPAGKDGTPGTTDDPAPVLQTLGYPDLSARRQAFDAATSMLGDHAVASLHRGRACFYAGEPRLGLAHDAEALRRCQANAVPDVARAVLQGFRAVRGHSAGLDDVGQFIACGLNGPDEAAGTADNVSDPFAPLGLAGASHQPGGLSPLLAEEIGPLRLVLQEARDLSARPGLPSRRVAALQACQRTCEALVVVDRPATLAWVLESMRRETDGQVLGALAHLGQTVAKADQLDLAGVRLFDRDMLRLFEQTQRTVPAEVLEAQRQTEHTFQGLLRKTPARKP